MKKKLFLIGAAVVVLFLISPAISETVLTQNLPEPLETIPTAPEIGIEALGLAIATANQVAAETAIFEYYEPTPIYGTPAPPTPYVVEKYSDLEMNIASGEKATNFSARLTDGSTFRLSEHLGEYVLLFPTVVGCGDCMFGINVITFVNEDYPVAGLEILIMDLYIDDHTAIWADFEDALGISNISWGVVDTETFALDYEVTTLGPLFLINPEGEIVFRSKHPITYYQLEALFGLIEAEI